MHRIVLGCVLAGLLCAFSVAADAPLLPNQFGPWQAEAPSKTLQAQELKAAGSKWPGAESVLSEAGVSRIEQRAYKNGADEISLRVFVSRDPSSAFELYTFLLAPGMKASGPGGDSAGDGKDARFQVGNIVVQAEISPGAKSDGLPELLAALRAKSDQTPLPPVKNYLPERGRTFGSEKYALGPDGFRAAMGSLGQEVSKDLIDAVGFQNGAEAMLANYHGQHGSGVLVLLDYPTPQLAEQHRHHVELALPEAAKSAGVTVERKASLLSLVFAASSAEYARAMRDAVNYETQVTWNERGQQATDPPIMLIMYKIFLFTGLFLGVATGIGIAFGGFRVIVKRLFPGKVFDRPENIEVLQLGLSGKKIDPSDMY
ncbi:MAG TPA: DUF6599 family protein [Candidatus Limnocylindrales bacterium]|nr:DUF6599 family protein [Candidatus Limnocylindrales bacterium]